MRLDRAALLLQIESMRLAFSDTLQYCGDPDQSHVAQDELLSKPYARKRRADLFSPNKVQALHADTAINIRIDSKCDDLWSAQLILAGREMSVLPV